LVVLVKGISGVAEFAGSTDVRGSGKRWISEVAVFGNTLVALADVVGGINNLGVHVTCAGNAGLHRHGAHGASDTGETESS
jgi:hypothetical protein